MESLPQYLLIVLAVGLVVILFFRQLRLVVQFLVFMAKVVLVLFLLLLAGWFVGWWELPRPVAILFYGLGKLLEPLREGLQEWIRAYLR